MRDLMPTPSRRSAASTPPHLLVVEPDDELRDLYALILSEEGYALTLVRTLDDALAVLDEHTFALILADLYTWTAPRALDSAHTLRRQAHPTPIGLLSTQSIPSEEASAAGFAFLIHLPFDLDTFLTQIASTLARPFSDEQRRHMEVIARYIAAIEAGDAAAQAATCCEDVIFYPPPASAVTTTRRLIGRTAVQAYFARCNEQYRSVTFEASLPYARPKGIALRYTACWITPDGMRQCASAVALFHFKEGAIAQVGIRMDLARLRMEAAIQRSQ